MSIINVPLKARRLASRHRGILPAARRAPVIERDGNDSGTTSSAGVRRAAGDRRTFRGIPSARCTRPRRCPGPCSTASPHTAHRRWEFLRYCAGRCPRRSARPGGTVLVWTTLVLPAAELPTYAVRGRARRLPRNYETAIQPMRSNLTWANNWPHDAIVVPQWWRIICARCYRHTGPELVATVCTLDRAGDVTRRSRSRRLRAGGRALNEPGRRPAGTGGRGPRCDRRRAILTAGHHRGQRRRPVRDERIPQGADKKLGEAGGSGSVLALLMSDRSGRH